MEQKKTLARNSFSYLLVQLGGWLFYPSISVLREEEYCFRKIHVGLFGKLIKASIYHFSDMDASGVILMMGISRFHFDIDLISNRYPEREIRLDRRCHSIDHHEDNLTFKSWFLGFEGIGIYRELSGNNGYGNSSIEIGAHPLISLGLINHYSPFTHHAVVGFKLLNLQLNLHSALDAKLDVPR